MVGKGGHVVLLRVAASAASIQSTAWPCWTSAPCVPSPSSSARQLSGSAASPAPAAASEPAFARARREIEAVTERLRQGISSDIPALGTASEYFFRRGAEGKRVRSTTLLLMADVLAETPPPDSILYSADLSPASSPPSEVRRRQQRLSEITELIHVASLLHDDVIDGADTRRGAPAVNAVFGNKVAILAGDFLLARASVSLASLRDTRVIELMSRVLEHLVAGEILQLTVAPADALKTEHYLKKTYYKTASLLAHSCRSQAILGQASAQAQQAAEDFGTHLGLAFQIVDDVLDFTASADELGKPALNDLRSGLATAPVLLALPERPELLPLIQRKFAQPGDVESAEGLVRASGGVAAAQRMAR
ncbi:polyprenyl synthetase, partial [Helicosporidium sp. ATCC 50920]